MLHYRQYQDIQSFSRDTVPCLEKNEAFHNLLLGLLAASGKQGSSCPLLMGVFQKKETIQLILFQTEPQQIIVSAAEPVSYGEIEVIASTLIHECSDIHGFVGERDITIRIAAEVAKQKNYQYRIVMNQRIYELRELKKQPDESGEFRKLTLQDLLFIENAVYDFCEDTLQPLTRSEAKNKCRELYGQGGLYGWAAEGRIVAMANATRPTRNNMNINFVFTPRELRGRGYASNCVAALTKSMLNKGYKTASLYTDLSNPTSNKIYMDIGFKPVGDSVLIHFL
ncbi:GNAT family N-acetyltransferase [Metabacillus lacus]|nr:GNAT family N-acetyltransferase [Metabacillus lacus]